MVPVVSGMTSEPARILLSQNRHHRRDLEAVVWVVPDVREIREEYAFIVLWTIVHHVVASCVWSTRMTPRGGFDDFGDHIAKEDSWEALG